jgi:quinolinate synthase
VATESGILYQMKKRSPDKSFIPAPPLDSTCGCNDCNFMKLVTIEKIYLTLLHEAPEISLDMDIINRASAPIRKMLEISARKNPT